MMYRLIILNGPLINQRISIEPSPMLIGRDPACHISVPDDEMAREHAQIEHRADGLYVTDLGSMNRILVNKREVHEARLKHGDTIEIGRTRFLVQALVQAEVEGARRQARRRQWRAVGVAVVLVLLAVVGLNHWVEVQARRAAAASAARAAEWVRIKSERYVKTAGAEAPAPWPPADGAKEDLEELQKVREDLAVLRETMKALAERSPATSAIPQAQLAPEPDSKQRCGDLLAQALDALHNNQPLHADQLLTGALALDPSFWPAYEERARLFERRGMAEEALRQWNDLIQRQPPPDVYERAVAERLRLSRAIRAGEAKAVRVVEVVQHKVLAAENYEEMRVLQVSLRAESPDYLLEPEKIRVEVDFYDEDAQQGRIERTSAMVAPRVLKWSGPWRRDGINTVSVHYAVPQGRRGGNRYYGFVVQVFYNDRLQEIVAKPKSLLNMVRAAGAPATAGGSGT
jgi:tetratricopeptide (TPR) repeat protein